MQVVRDRWSALSRRSRGVAIAMVTAIISGFAVFVNGYAVQAWAGTADPVTYTTLKNTVAAGALVGVGVIAVRRGGSDAPRRPAGLATWVRLGVVAVLGGALAFGLFFEGLSRASSVQAAFIHKSLIVWVGILAVGFLHEKIGALHIVAIVALFAGQWFLVGGASGLSLGSGELLILAATLAWSIEVVVAKRTLADVPSMTVGLARMVGGSAVLLAYGALGGAFAGLSTASISQLAWIGVTGVVLAGYVGTWYAALARAQAVDVTAILVGGALITGALRYAVSGAPAPDLVGVALITLGVLLTVAGAVRRSNRPATSQG